MADVWKDGKKVEEVTFSGGTFDSSGRTLTPSGGGGGSVATDAIFTAKGDLPVGTGASTAQKVSVGANDYGLIADSVETTGVKWAPVFRGSTGTSMPGSPSTNDRVFRTDLGLEFFYDGTRWLSSQLFTIHGIMLASNGTAGLTNAANISQYATDQTLSLYMQKLTYNVYVSTTNSGSAYWTLNLKEADGTVLDTFNTSALSPNTGYSGSRTVNTVVTVVGSGGAVTMDCTKTSTPGQLFGSMVAWYRLIGT